MKIAMANDHAGPKLRCRCSLSCYGCVAEDGRDHLEVHADGEHEGSVGVAQGVEGDALEVRALDEVLELPLHIVVVNVVAFLCRENHFWVAEVGNAFGALP